MYVPTAFREENIENLVAFMRAHSFATLISIRDQAPVATHVPLVVSLKEDVITLSGHLAKQNSQWQSFGDNESLAVFTGPHAYVSPTAYEKRENVPTWNYMAVHAYGIPKPIVLAPSPDDPDRSRESRESMETMIDDMIETYEVDYKSQWDALAENYRVGQMKGIVGFEMTVTRLDGKYKLSQNRSHTDQANVAHMLIHQNDSEAQAIGEAMQQNLESHDDAKE